jgi:hypothetical protein
MQDKTSEIKPERDENGRLLPGNTANPNGRPKGSFSLVEMIKHKLQEIPEGKDKTYAEYFIEQMMKKTVVEGDVSMMRDMINRVDGMPKQAIEQSGEVGLIIKQVKYEGDNDSPSVQSEAVPAEDPQGA